MLTAPLCRSKPLSWCRDASKRRAERSQLLEHPSRTPESSRRVFAEWVGFASWVALLAAINWYNLAPWNKTAPIKHVSGAGTAEFLSAVRFGRVGGGARRELVATRCVLDSSAPLCCVVHLVAYPAGEGLGGATVQYCTTGRATVALATMIAA
jgi:hypothetical protein